MKTIREGKRFVGKQWIGKQVECWQCGFVGILESHDRVNLVESISTYFSVKYPNGHEMSVPALLRE